MFSYEHRYHAGNFADVHKHMALMAILQHLAQKPTPFTVMDTHAGEGIYDLQSPEAQRLKEYDKGIEHFKLSTHLTPLAQQYIDLVASFNPLTPNNTTQHYPGSAAIIQQHLREQDSAILIEHHPQAIVALKQNLGKYPGIHIHNRDALSALPALLPFQNKRGLVFIDPSYEVKTEYTSIIETVMKGYRKFSNGVFVIWYPLLSQGFHIGLKQALEKTGIDEDKILIHEWIPYGKQAQGLYGSGLAIINPPWQLEKQLTDSFR